jgi:hypothetical protein
MSLALQSVSSVTAVATLPIAVTAGSALIGGVIWAGNPGQAPTGFTAATGPWAIQPFGMLLNPYLQLFYKFNAAAGVTSITFPSDNTVQASFLAEFPTLNTFIKGVGAAGFGNANPFSTPNITGVIGDILIALAMSNGENLTAVNFATEQSLTAPKTIFADFQVVTAGLTKATFKGINIDSSAVVMAQFRHV